MITRRLNRWILWSVLGAGLVGCSSAPYLYEKNGGRPGETVTGVARDKLVNVQNFNGWRAAVYLSPQCIQEANGVKRFQIIVQLSRAAQSYVLIKAGRSLRLTIDGQTYLFSTKQGSGPRRSVLHESFGEKTLSESAIYDGITPSDLDRISQAKEINVEIIGKNQTVTAQFSEINFSAFQTLYDKSKS